MINFIPKEQLEAAGKATIASHNLLQIDQKCVNHIRVEMRSPSGTDQLPGAIEGNRLLVNPAGNQRIKNVGEGHQAGRKGNPLSRQPVRVTTAVPAFVMVAGDFLGNGEERHRPLGVFLGGRLTYQVNAQDALDLCQEAIRPALVSLPLRHFRSPTHRSRRSGGG